MLTEERYDRILDILEEENYCTAESLGKRLFVSLPTIRRDLAELQRRNLIIRSHGGAKKLGAESMVSPISFRKTVNLAVKKRLCKAASKLIKAGSIIFIDASTTAFHIADYITPDFAVTVVTNSVPLTAYLTKKGIKTYTTGGALQENSMCYAGSYAEEFIRNFNFDFTFFSSFGVNESGMITDTSEPETSLRKTVITQTSKSVFMCDSSKFSLSAPYNLMPLKNADYIITDKENAKQYADESGTAEVIFIGVSENTNAKN